MAANEDIVRIHGLEYRLSEPDTWPSEAWRAFEKAHHERITANINANEHRRVGQAGAHITS